MIQYCITNNIITKENIKSVIYSSLSIPANYYNKFIDFLNKNIDDKLCVNTMIGCFKPKVKENWNSLCFTSDNNVAFYHFIKKMLYLSITWILMTRHIMKYI